MELLVLGKVRLGKRKDICSELSTKPSEPEAEVEAIPLNDGTEWKPLLVDYEEYCRLYPGVDIKQEFANMRGWSNSNPTKRKTLRGVKRFVNSWLSREQDKGSTPKNKSSSKPNSFNQFQQNEYDYDDLLNKIKKD